MKKTRVAIIGSGPAGYTAAIYTARANLEPILIGGIKNGGQLMFTTVVENFPGFARGVNGPELMINMRQQAERFGAQLIDEWVTRVDFSVQPFKIWTKLPEEVDPMKFDSLKSEEYQKISQDIAKQEPDVEAEAVIVATGAASIMLGIPGEDRLLGRGVATCAVCDAAFYKDKIAYVVGGGDSAMEDALALTKFAKEVKIVHRRDQFKASKVMQDRVLKHPKIEIIWNSQVVAALGEEKLVKIKIKNLLDQSEREAAADGLFYAIGHRPVTNLFAGQLQLDDRGYIVTGQTPSRLGCQLAQSRLNQQNLVEFPTMTSVSGVFAAGDVVDIRYKQAITSAGQGAAAALDAEHFLADQG